jgi:hypothetical protein
MVEVPAFSGAQNSCGEANNGDGNDDQRSFHILQYGFGSEILRPVIRLDVSA